VRVLYITHPASLCHDPQALSPGHPDDPRRLKAIEEAVEEAEPADLWRAAAPVAAEGELTLVHGAPDMIVTPRAARHLAQRWTL
jgi:acetoin utilization deacetylase AcuC-like enzyme